MGKKILIATRTPRGLPGGSGFHLRNMIEVLQKNGHEIEIHHPFMGDYDTPIKEEDYLVGPHFEPDVIIVDYSWMCSAFSCFKNVLKICFVHDLRCRIIPCLEAIGYKDAQGWTEEKEAELLRKADILLVLNDEDKAYCERMAPNCKIIRIGIAMEPVEHDPAKEIPGRCIYVGSSVLENKWAFSWFYKEVWDKVQREIPHAELKFFPIGTDDEYAQAQIAVVPHIMLGGLKIKTAEAFAHGLPVVGNTCAFDGFEKWPLSTDDPQRMAEMIINVMNDFESNYYFERIVKDEYQPLLMEEKAYGCLLEELK